MIEAVWDNAFKRSYRKRIHRVPHLKNQFREKMELFLEEPFDPHLRTHAPPRGSQKNNHPLAALRENALSVIR